MSDNFKAKNDHYSHDELRLMSYQDLRRISVSLKLPANIKKNHMVSMIQAHQKGDDYLKAIIAKKVLEERRIDQLKNKNRSKFYMLTSSINSHQEMCGNCVKNNSVIESQVFQSSITNSPSTVIVNNRLTNDGSGGSCNINLGNYLFANAGNADFKITSPSSEMNFQHCRKDENAGRSSNESQGFLNFYPSLNAEPSVAPQGIHLTSLRDVAQSRSRCLRIEDNKEVTLSVPHPPVMVNYGSGYTEKDDTIVGFLSTQTQGSYSSEVPNSSSANLLTEAEWYYKLTNFSRYPYTLGHNKCPETVSGSSTITTLPSFSHAFCSNDMYGTAETHLNPIMTCTYASQFAPRGSISKAPVNNICSQSQSQGQWYDTYPDTQAPFSVDSTYYADCNKYCNDAEKEITPQNNNHNSNVQVAKCETQGCHNLYSVSNPTRN